MSRYVDLLPMTIRFTSLLLEKYPTADEQKLVDRAHKIAQAIAEKHQTDPCPADGETRYPTQIVRVKKSDGAVDKMWTNTISSPRR